VRLLLALGPNPPSDARRGSGNQFRAQAVFAAMSGEAQSAAGFKRPREEDEDVLPDDYVSVAAGKPAEGCV
jgi:hypothetical protein